MLEFILAVLIFQSTQGLPASFDSRSAWPSCSSPILFQGSCGSSWAISSVSVLSDRICIFTPNSTLVPLSPQYIIDCDYIASGCYGGQPEDAWGFLMSHGAVTESCVPYQGIDNRCPSTCSNGDFKQMVMAQSFSIISGTSIIQNEIYKNGPVVCTMTVYEDFFQYTGGVYRHVWGFSEGSLSVRVLGWGTSGGSSYWICSASLGTNWGISGYFWIAFGQCEICEFAVTGMPSFDV